MRAATLTRTHSRWPVLAVLLAIALSQSADADVGPPVHMQITETDENLYTVQWRVPKVLPPRAVPTPMLPETCRPVTEAKVVNQPAAWLVEADWRCDAPLAGQVVGLDYPFPDLSLTTVVRVDLRSGDRFARVMSQGEESWKLPEGTVAPDILEGFRRAVLAGAAHATSSWLHLVFVVTLGLLGRVERTIRLVTACSVGQLIGVVAASLVGSIGPPQAETGFAIGIVVIARQVLEPDRARSTIWAAVGAAGFIHGLGFAPMLTDTFGDRHSSLFPLVLAVLGMDAVHLVLGFVLTVLFATVASGPLPVRVRRTSAYAIGSAGLAAAVAFSVHDGSATQKAPPSSLMMPADNGLAAAAGSPGSRRVAPTTPDTAVQSYLSVEPFEIRHEVMLRLVGLTEELGLDAGSTVEVGTQFEVAEHLSDLVADNTEVFIDGAPAAGQISRADFMTVDPTGALPRPNAVPEPVVDAVIGVIVSYPTPGMPRRVVLEWHRFPTGIDVIPATVIDPENVVSSVLSTDRRRLAWEYALLEDPVPTVEAVPVEPVELPVPWLSLPLFLAAGWLVVTGLRGDRLTIFVAAARVMLAVALAAGPLVETAIALPGSSGRTPSERQARRILAGLLPNVYRALEFRSEELIYDRLAISVTGDTLSEVYLEQRRTLEIEERGGAQARVEAVEILDATQITARDHGFEVRAVWTVGGMVTHFGHRHFRQNRYDAVLDIVPVDETWKIRSVEILETERLK